jgi:hypothetical protein
MQVAGDCFASSQKYYHAAVTILKIKLMIFLGFCVDGLRNLLGRSTCYGRVAEWEMI